MLFNEKTDPYTGEVFIPSRANQVFATEENRIAFNNAKAKTLRERKAFVNKPLHANQRILSELLGGKAFVEVHRQFLLGKGFSLNTFTHYSEHQGKSYPSVYEFTIIPLGNDQFKIIRNHD